MYTLLIVDDEPLMRRGIKLLADLAALNISEVYEASNGESALEIITERSVDIILLDINMPKMDGLTFAKKAKETLKDVKICMITGYDYFEYAVQALRVGVDEYILKPVTKKDIEAVLKKIIQSIEKQAVVNEVIKLDIKKEVHKSFEDDLKVYMEHHIFNQQLSLSETASTLGFSAGYLSGIFKEIYGIPFQDYVTKKRIEKAKYLLISTDMKNYEIADQIGYEDVNYFSTKFKKSVGSTPKQYKNKVKQNENQ